MKKRFLLVFFFFSFLGYSQEDAWVYFKDKPNAQIYFDNPLEMLSQRSLDRRTAYNIPLDIKDVLIYKPYVNQIKTAVGIEVKAQSKWFNAVHVRGSVSDINNLLLLAFVDHIQFADRSLNGTGKSSKTLISNHINKVNKVLETDTNFPYGSSANQIQMLNAHLLHQQNYTGSGKIIAVMDSGFPGVNVAAPFQRLRDNNQILGGYNFVDRNDNVYTRNSHGAKVISTMGGYVENQLVGAAPDAGYYLFITEDGDSENPIEESNWVEAAEVADSLGVDVITTSLGYFKYDNPKYSYTYNDVNGTTSFISKGSDVAFSRGMICVASAGNSGASVDSNIGVPADAINTLAVGAVQADRTYATFSSVGPSFDGRMKPDVMAQGQDVVVSNPDGEMVTASGTSFSGPIVAGAISCFWQAIPWANNLQVVNFVKQSADKFSNPTNQLGYGIPDFKKALDMAQLSVNDASSAKFLVYPNPVSDKLFVSFSTVFDQVKISLYNILGQLVFEKNIQNSESAIAMDGINSGVYLYKIESNSFVQSGKIIKN